MPLLCYDGGRLPVKYRAIKREPYYGFRDIIFTWRLSFRVPRLFWTRWDSTASIHYHLSIRWPFILLLGIFDRHADRVGLPFGNYGSEEGEKTVFLFIGQFLLQFPGLARKKQRILSSPFFEFFNDLLRKINLASGWLPIGNVANIVNSLLDKQALSEWYFLKCCPFKYVKKTYKFSLALTVVDSVNLACPTQHSKSLFFSFFLSFHYLPTCRIIANVLFHFILF